MGVYTLVYLFNGMLKEEISDTHNNFNESQRHYCWVKETSLQSYITI